MQGGSAESATAEAGSKVAGADFRGLAEFVECGDGIFKVTTGTFLGFIQQSAKADKIASLGRPKYQNQAQTWGREEGNRLSTLAFAWLISREKAYLDAATVWAREISAKPGGLGQVQE